MSHRSMSGDKLHSSSMELPIIGSHIRSRKQVASRPFAGRVGANQGLCGDSDSHQPDAAPLSSFKSVIALRSFTSVELWRLAILEGLGSCLFNFAVASLASGLSASNFSVPVQVVLGAIINWFGLALFTYVLGPITGAHITPTITLTTLFIGLTTLPRAVMYISGQVTGAIVAGYWLKLGAGDAYFHTGIIPGCSVIPGKISAGQMFVLEFGFCLLLIFLACGLGLDPRQHSTLSPTYAPVLIGLSLGIANIASAFAAPGWTGLSFNPARCLGLMTPLGNWQYHYVHWLAPLSAAITNGVIYRIVPPWTTKV